MHRLHTGRHVVSPCCSNLHSHRNFWALYFHPIFVYYLNTVLRPKMSAYKYFGNGWHCFLLDHWCKHHWEQCLILTRNALSTIHQKARIVDMWTFGNICIMTLNNIYAYVLSWFNFCSFFKGRPILRKICLSFSWSLNPFYRGLLLKEGLPFLLQESKNLLSRIILSYLYERVANTSRSDWSLLKLHPLYTGGMYNCYLLYEFICHFRGVWSILSLSLYFDRKSCKQNVGLDQTPHYVAYDLGLHFLTTILLRVSCKNGLIETRCNSWRQQNPGAFLTLLLQLRLQ